MTDMPKNWTELKELRERFGGGDGQAINRHSQRYYRWEAVGFFCLDRNLSCSAPYFTLMELQADPRIPVERGYIPQVIRFDGREEFGDGLSWPAAEEAAQRRIREIYKGGQT